MTTKTAMTRKKEAKPLEDIREVRRGLLALAHALLHAATTTILAATGALVTLVDVTVVEVIKLVRKPSARGRPV